MSRTLRQLDGVRAPLPTKVGGPHRDRRVQRAYRCELCGTEPCGMQLVLTVLHGAPVRVCVGCIPTDEEER